MQRRADGDVARRHAGAARACGSRGSAATLPAWQTAAASHFDQCDAAASPAGRGTAHGDMVYLDSVDGP